MKSYHRLPLISIGLVTVVLGANVAVCQAEDNNIQKKYPPPPTAPQQPRVAPPPAANARPPAPNVRPAAAGAAGSRPAVAGGRPAGEAVLNAPTAAVAKGAIARPGENPGAVGDAARREANAAQAGQAVASYSDEIALLREAHYHLSRADHDYDGRRVMAVKQTELAAKMLGASVGGGGEVAEGQAASDEQLRLAQESLERARDLAAGRHQLGVRDHVSAAIYEVSQALAVK
jgi:hypothetical protein